MDASQKANFEDDEVSLQYKGRQEALLAEKARDEKLLDTSGEPLLALDKPADAALQVSEVRYRRLFESAKDGILILDARSGKITDANPFIGELLGYSRADLVGKELWELGLFKDIERSKAAVRALQEQHYIRYEDLPLETREGKRRDVEVVSNVYREDHRTVIQCNIRDITARKRVEERVRESEQRFRALFELGPVAVYSCDVSGVIQEFNHRAVELWGREPKPRDTDERFCGSFRMVRPDGRVMAHEQCPMAEVLSGTIPSAHDAEVLIERPDGSRITVIVNIRALKNELGEITGALNCFYDITERKRVEELLRDSDRRKNEFLAMLAHELRNPLAPIRNALQILRLTTGQGADIQAASEMMERQVGQMVRLVDDLLDVSRISRGKIELRQGRIELASAVNHAVEAAHALCQSMNQELRVMLPSQPIYLHGDPTRLAQVVGNLLNNACKFTDQGGRISLAVEREGQQAVIRVRDSGVGIAADQLPRIFEMFVQVDTSLERSASGLGIGLSLVKSLVEMHGGTVAAHSAGLGQGSEFVVRLPILTESPAPPPEPIIGKLPPATSRRILVVDDNRDSATSLALLLKLTGNETHTAYDGLEAVEAATMFKPDLILMDIGLPKLNGYEACRRIREQPGGKNIVLMALTGWGQEEDRQKSSQAGFNGHLVKPVDSAALMKQMAEMQPPSA